MDVSWSSKLIREYMDDGFFEDAVKVYVKMLEYGVPVEEFQFFPPLIKAFGGLLDIGKVREIHAHLLKFRALDDVYVENSLLGVYWKCGEAEDAIQLFWKMPVKDSVSWNTMISGFYRSGDNRGSLRTFSQMIREHGVFPNRVACLSALSSCSALESLVHGKEIHAFVVKSGFDDDFLVSGLIDMYMKCGDAKNAQYVFDDEESIRMNAVIWNVMINGYVSNGNLSQAMDLFLEMLATGIVPDSSTMVAALVLCTELLDLAVGKQIHGWAISLGLNNDVRVETALTDMYFKCGDTKTGLDIFKSSRTRNTVMWGAVISNCAQSGFPIEALDLFHNYIIEYGFADSVLILAALRACSSLTWKSKGLQIHGLLVKSGLGSDVFIG
ncbi:Tetratricopeptide-like helical domain containing protein, partial [Trema orientale]